MVIGVFKMYYSTKNKTIDQVIKETREIIAKRKSFYTITITFKRILNNGK